MKSAEDAREMTQTYIMQLLVQGRIAKVPQHFQCHSTTRNFTFPDVSVSATSNRIRIEPLRAWDEQVPRQHPARFNDGSQNTYKRSRRPSTFVDDL